MKLSIYDMSKSKVGEINLPAQFDENIRPDLVKRAVIAIQNNKRQPYGAMPGAGKRASAKLSKRRRNYRGSYGFGISRTPRKILSRRGTRMFWVGAFAPNTVGGRRAHPPKAQKKVIKKINKKERRKAIRSGIAATVIRELVESRGHIVPEIYPFAVDEKIEGLSKTEDVLKALNSYGLEKELERINQKKIRSGKGKLRGRKYRTKTGPLIVVSKDSGLKKAANNIIGIDVASVKELNAEILAPGTVLGRLTLWTKSAIRTMEKENLFK
jgi:large subunit ribosomal protein L4e